MKQSNSSSNSYIAHWRRFIIGGFFEFSDVIARCHRTSNTPPVASTPSIHYSHGIAAKYFFQSVHFRRIAGGTLHRYCSYLSWETQVQVVLQSSGHVVKKIKRCMRVILLDLRNVVDKVCITSDVDENNIM